MFRNLEAEIARQKLKKADLAKDLGVTPSTLSLKLNGRAPISLDEILKIKKILKTNESVEYLFATDEQAATREVS